MRLGRWSTSTGHRAAPVAAKRVRCITGQTGLREAAGDRRKQTNAVRPPRVGQGLRGRGDEWTAVCSRYGSAE
ncbi:hypothetical protein Tco_0528672 [Tanacetum coccineum]